MLYPVKNIIVYDLEVYPNWFLAGFQVPDGMYYQFEFPEDSSTNETMLQALRDFLDWSKRDHVIAGWNSRSYDDAVLTHFLNHPSPDEAYLMSINIIQLGARSWELPNSIWSIDLKRVVPGNLGLKKIGVCLGHKRLQELPFPFDQPLTPDQMQIVKDYNLNDLDITRKVQIKLQPELDLRELMSEQYRLNMTSKGEAQIAESILIEESGIDPKLLKEKAKDNSKNSIYIREPSWWKNMRRKEYPEVDKILEIGEHIFKTEIPIMQNSLRIDSKPLSKTLYLGDKFYRMGVGGLHSVDGPGSIIPNQNQLLIDIDVASYYPNLILTQKLTPRHWGKKFLETYQSVVDRRLKAKREGDKITAAVLKIVANGTFGKTSEMYSSLYDPWVTGNVTVIGQLALLLLIAYLSNARDHNVVSANTDGITVLVSKSEESITKNIVKVWEHITGLKMEYTYYSGLYQLDVNNYMAITTDGKRKLKGRLQDETDLRHTPNFPIVAKAVQEEIQYGIPIESTILCCEDINQFILTQQVVGDWTTSWRDQPLGKMLRWYKSKYSLDPIKRHPGPTAKGNEGIVSNGENAMPLENLPDAFPDDILYGWYMRQAYDWYARMTATKTFGYNEIVNLWHLKGLHPVVLTDGKSTRARPAHGTIDFNGLLENETIGIGTGGDIVAKVNNDGSTLLYRTSKPYPGKTRKLVKKNHGFELIYGSSVEPTDFQIQEEQDWDEYYTPGELKRVGR